MITKESLEYVVGLSGNETIEIDGVTYAKKEYEKVS